MRFRHITYRFRGYARDCDTRDVLVTRRRNSKIMQNLSYKSSSFAKTSAPIHREMSASGFKEVMLLYSRVLFDVL